MQLGQIELPVYLAEAIVGNFLLRGGFQPIGPVLAYLNDPSRRYAKFKNTRLFPFESSNPFEQIKQSEIMLRKADIVAISLLDQAGIEATQLLNTHHKMIFYTDRFVIQGQCHMGADDLPLDLLNSGRNDYVGLTSATLYPLTSLRNSPIFQIDMLLLNRAAIQFYHLSN